MAEQTKQKKRQRKSSGGSKQKRTESGRRAGKTPGQRSDGSGRNKSPTAKKEGGSPGSSNGGDSGKSRNQGGDQTVPERMYEDYTLIDPGEISDTEEPDVVVERCRSSRSTRSISSWTTSRRASRSMPKSSTSSS